MEDIGKAVELNRRLETLNSRSAILSLIYITEIGTTNAEKIRDEIYKISFDYYKSSLELLETYRRIKLTLSQDLQNRLERIIKNIDVNLNKIAEGMERFDE